MNKKILAIAVGATFAAPVFAQDSGIQIYGRVYPAFATFKASGATAPGAIPSTLVDPGSTQSDLARRNSIDAYNTRVGFRGREMLGGGLSAIWQIEQRVQIDTGGSGFWASRNSFVGLRGGFGTVRLGQFDTVYKEYGAVVSTFGISSGHFLSTSSVLSSSGVGFEDAAFGPDAGFHIRADNSIQYETPEIGGFQAAIHYSPDEAKGNPGRDQDANLWSFGVKYEAGPLYLSLQHERHNDWVEISPNTPLAGLMTESSDKATRLSAGYRMGIHRFTFDIAQMEWDESGPGVGLNYDKVTWDIAWEARWGGPWRTQIGYAKANEGDCTATGIVCTTDGLDASQLNLAVAYNLSKRTFIYGAFTRLSMGESARYDNWTNGTPPRGSDVTQMALGVTHNF
jgi:predicted porin